MFLSGSFKEMFAVHLQCPGSCDCDVPIGKMMGTSQIFPKKVPVMFLSGSFKEFFAVSPVMGLQCSQPVKFKMSQNGVQEMTQSGTFQMYPLRPPQCTTFSKNPGHLRNTARFIQNVPSFPVSQTFPCSVPEVSWIFAESGTLGWS